MPAIHDSPTLSAHSVSIKAMASFMVPTMLALSLAATASASALYTSKDFVITANGANFNSVVMKTEHPVVVEFYAPWCGHCQQLAPEYVKAASSLQGLAKVVAIDCDDDRNKQLCAKFDIKGFPTIKVFSGGVKGAPEDYNGDRKSKAIVSHMISKIYGKYVKQIGVAGKKTLTMDDFLADTEMPRMVFISKKDVTSPLLKAFSVSYKGRLTVGEVKSTNAKFAEKITTKSPAVFIWPKDAKVDDEPVEYTGELKQKPLKEFINKKEETDKTKDKEPKKEVKEEKLKEDKEEKHVEKESVVEDAFDPLVPELKSQEDLEKLCLDKAGICVISFITSEPEYSESVAALNTHLETLQKVKLAMHKKPTNPFTFVWVNPIKCGLQLIKDFQVSDMYPSVLVLNSKKRAYGLLRAAFDDGSVVQFLKDVLAGKGGILKFDFQPRLDRLSAAASAVPVKDESDADADADASTEDEVTPPSVHDGEL
ncbi:hypothetical protein BASA61_001158 [Batrachochytrium salamandrivorans]|nr:hypothetical protein BASA62_005616 [Batrachochytrium salamandrivorans]KAH6602410.1 hypothetical protein BASA61_001158 [Batrachochytrium salamandrivorans]